MRSAQPDPAHHHTYRGFGISD